MVGGVKGKKGSVRMEVRSSRLRMAAVGIIALLGMVAMACGSSIDDVNAIDLVPAKSNLLGSVDLALVLSDADVQTGYEKIAATSEDAPATFKELLVLVEEKVGVGLTEFNKIIVFGDLESADENTAGLLASGSPPQEEIFKALLSVEGSEYEAAEYAGQNLLVSGGDDSATTVLGGVLVTGSVSAVHGVVDVFNGDADALEGNLLTAYDELGDVWIKMVFDVWAGAANELVGDSGGIGLPIDWGGLLAINRITVVAERTGNDGVLVVTLVYATEEEATETAQTLDALLTLVSSFSKEPQLDSLTEMLSISSTGVDVELEVRQTVQEMLDSLGGVLQNEGSLVPSF